MVHAGSEAFSEPARDDALERIKHAPIHAAEPTTASARCGRTHCHHRRCHRRCHHLPLPLPHTTHSHALVSLTWPGTHAPWTHPMHQGMNRMSIRSVDLIFVQCRRRSSTFNFFSRGCMQIFWAPVNTPVPPKKHLIPWKVNRAPQRTHNQHAGDDDAPPRHTTNSLRFTNGMLAITSPNAILTRARHKMSENGRSPGVARRDDDAATHPETSASLTPTSQGLPGQFFPGFPGGAAQAPAKWRWTTASTPVPRTKTVVSGAAGNENIPTTGGDGGWRHTLPAKEVNALTPPGLPIDQRRRTSAWQRWKPRRKTASVSSGRVRGPALNEGNRLETRG